MARKLIQSAVIDSIRKHEQKTYEEIGDSIGLHRSHIQKVSKGVRQLSEEKFNELCQRWKINLTDMIHQVKLDDAQYLKRKTLLMLIKAREISLEQLSKSTGISLLDLNQIQRERRHPTSEEIEILAEVLEVDSNIIEEGAVAVVFQLIEKSLNYLHVDPSAIDAVIKFLEREV